VISTAYEEFKRRKEAGEDPKGILDDRRYYAVLLPEDVADTQGDYR